MFDKSVVINRLVLRFFHFTFYTIQKRALYKTCLFDKSYLLLSLPGDLNV